MIRALVLLLAAVTGLKAQVGDRHEASTAYARCATCHGTPDRSLPWDDAWIGRIASTACVQPPAPKGERQRAALMAWLRSDTAPRVSTETATRALAAGEGALVVPFERGSVLLVPEVTAGETDERGEIRLVWSGEAGPRAVPAGVYRVRHYRVERAGAAGATWQLWASGKGRRIAIAERETADLDLDLRVHVKAQVHRRSDALQVGLGVTGDSGMGATVVCAGERVPARYAFTAAAGAPVTGDLAYG